MYIIIFNYIIICNYWPLFVTTYQYLQLQYHQLHIAMYKAYVNLNYES
jgi:hypothetical protein